MKITKVELKISKKPSYFKGWAKVTLDDALIIGSIRLLEEKGADGMISYKIQFPDRMIPNKKSENEKVTIPVVTVTDAKLRKDILEAIIDEYDEQMKAAKEK